MIKLMCGFLLIGFLCQCNSAANQNSDADNIQNQAVVQESEVVLDNQSNQESELPSINIDANDIVKSPLKISVNSEGKWAGFEGELGTIELFDENDNTIGRCILSTTENWMVIGPVNYHCELEYNAGSPGNGRLLVQKNNPTGEEEFDKSFEIPVQYIAN